jgi:hypothetical protein
VLNGVYKTMQGVEVMHSGLVNVVHYLGTGPSAVKPFGGLVLQNLSYFFGE